MKRFAVLGLALVLVLGMSGIATADEIGDGAEVDVTINVAAYAEAAFGEAPDMNVPKPGPENHYGYAIHIPLSVQSNTQFRLELKENVSRTIATSVTSQYSNVDEDFVWAFDDAGHDSNWDSYNFIVSPGVEIWGKHTDGSPGTPGGFGYLTHESFRWEDGMGAVNTFPSEMRKFDGFATLDLAWQEENKSEKDYDWTMLEAASYTGQIIATVEAVN